MNTVYMFDSFISSFLYLPSCIKKFLLLWLGPWSQTSMKVSFLAYYVSSIFIRALFIVIIMRVFTGYYSIWQNKTCLLSDIFYERGASKMLYPLDSWDIHPIGLKLGTKIYANKSFWNMSKRIRPLTEFCWRQHLFYRNDKFSGKSRF